MIFAITLFLTINYILAYFNLKYFKIQVTKDGETRESGWFFLATMGSVFYQLYFWFHYFQII